MGSLLATDRIYPRLVIVYLIFMASHRPLVEGSGCGGYLKPGASETGTITSPNYPSNYGNNANCVWLVEAPSGHAVSLNITGVAGEQDTGSTCVDYLEIRNGSSEQTVQYYGCTAGIASTVQARWLWIKFTTNYGTVNTGFTASWSVVSDASSSSVSEPFIECPMEFSCKNKQCVPWSYRCDGYNDCGCDDTSCDEVGCQGFNFSMHVKIGLGVGVGVGFFIITFFGIGILDIYLKKRSERKYQERMELQKKLSKQKKAKAMAALFVTQPSTDGSRNSGSLRAPSISTINSQSPSGKT